LIDNSIDTSAHFAPFTTQVIAEAQQPLSRYYRHISKGAWPFSSRDHGWPISDCTSEVRKQAHLHILRFVHEVCCAATGIDRAAKSVNAKLPTRSKY
jgi:hypothetical protein